jgi:ubiquinone/menaquinone biosynthesis C-methylase UbiE
MESKKPAGSGLPEEFWDSFADTYIECAEPYNSPLALQLALQTKADQAQTVLEVACGSGFAAAIISPLLKPGSTYCCLDRSKSMIRHLEKRFTCSTFLCNPRNTFAFASASPAVKVDPGKSKPEGVAVHAYQGNNERLPFVDSAFDSYLAAGSLCVMDSPVAMVQEAYRVLKAGGLAGFGVVGKEKDSTLFSIASELVFKYATKYNVKLPEQRSLFHLGENEAGLVKMIRDVGFTDLKVWHEHSILAITLPQFMAEKKMFLMSILSLFPPAAGTAFQAELEAEVNRRFITGNELITIDYVCIVCRKPSAHP